MGLTLSVEHCDGDSWVTELNEGSSLVRVQSVPGQQNVLRTHKSMNQLFVLL